jgi:hypothetical protein
MTKDQFKAILIGLLESRDKKALSALAEVVAGEVNKSRKR